MNMKEIDNENAKKENATGDNVYTIHTVQIHTNKYIKHDPSKPTTTSIKDREVCECTHNKWLAIEISRRL